MSSAEKRSSRSNSSNADQRWAQAKAYFGQVLSEERAEKKAAADRQRQALAGMEGRGALGELMKACLLNDLAGARAALAQGAPVDGLDGHGDCALRVCAHLGRLDIMQLLIQHGASLNLHNRLGETALDAAIDRNDIDGAEILLLSGARTDSRSTLVLDIGAAPGAVRAILNADLPETLDPWGAVPPPELPALMVDKSIRGEQPLARAATRALRVGDQSADMGSQPLIRLLLSMGADPNDTDGFGRSATMKAIFAGDIDASWSLIQAGADPEATDAEGRRARDFALLAPQRWSRDEIENMEDEFQDAVASRDA